jgi:hypothetical protein
MFAIIILIESITEKELSVKVGNPLPYQIR